MRWGVGAILSVSSVDVVAGGTAAVSACVVMHAPSHVRQVAMWWCAGVQTLLYVQYGASHGFPYGSMLSPYKKTYGRVLAPYCRGGNI